MEGQKRLAQHISSAEGCNVVNVLRESTYDSGHSTRVSLTERRVPSQKKGLLRLATVPFAARRHRSVLRSVSQRCQAGRREQHAHHHAKAQQHPFSHEVDRAPKWGVNLRQGLPRVRRPLRNSLRCKEGPHSPSCSERSLTPCGKRKSRRVMQVQDTGEGSDRGVDTLRVGSTPAASVKPHRRGSTPKAVAVADSAKLSAMARQVRHIIQALTPRQTQYHQCDFGCSQRSPIRSWTRWGS